MAESRASRVMDRGWVGRVGYAARRHAGLLIAVVLACGAFGAGTSNPLVAGAARHFPNPARAAGPAAGRVSPASEPQVCDGCVPPLAYGGGPVMASADGVTVTPIYWEPSGGQYTFPANYEDILNTFIANVAAASGSSADVFSVATEYYQNIGGAKTTVAYKIKAATPLIDTNPLPSDGCPADSGYTACITDAQLRTELAQVTTSEKLPTDLAHFYPVFLPPKVESVDLDGTNSVSGFCGYHRAFGSASNQTVYGDEPYPPPSGCDAGQAPNGDLAADAAVNTLSHELNEAITDPLAPQNAWLDQSGHEIGDMCADTYGPPVGSTDPAKPASTEYNQVINGGKYYTQTEFSNAAFAKYGLGKGCAQDEALAQGATSTAATPGTTTQAPGTAAAHAIQAQSTGSLFAEATPTAVDADGTSTSKFVVSVADPAGNARVGDHVHFNVGAKSGTGTCGALNTSAATTDANGYARVTYTASSDNIACWVLAVDAAGGQSAQSIIYQGTAQKDAATLAATFPTTLEAGGPTSTFTIKATNPSAKPLPNARVTFDIFGEPGAKGVNANQIHLSYSTAGANGPFTKVPLDGSTSNGGGIEGPVGPAQGATLAPHAARTYTFQVKLADTVPASKTAGPLIAVEAYLDQINTASESGDTLADSYATDIKVPTAVSRGLAAGWYIVIAVGGLVILLAAGFLFWRRHKSRPQTPSTGATTA